MQSIERKISGTLDKDRGISGMKREFKKNGILYLIVLPVIVYYFIFHYMPLYGLLMAFQDFSPRRGISGSDWVGLTHFINFFRSPDFARVVTNTLRISLSCLVFEFPAPIIMAILINELNGKYFKRTIQTISYLPHFISLVVICGMIKTFVEPDGIIGSVFAKITGNGSSMLSQSKMFLPIYVVSNIWQSIGWESIIYLAALMNIDPQLYEAADIDGAGGIKKFFYVTLPLMCPSVKIIVVTGLIGGMKVFDIIYSMTSGGPGNATETVMTVMMKKGISDGFYSTGSAFGVCFFAIVLVISAVVTKLMGKWSDSIQ